jgi:PAS domain S-box-containing protein
VKIRLFHIKLFLVIIAFFAIGGTTLANKNVQLVDSLKQVLTGKTPSYRIKFLIDHSKKYLSSSLDTAEIYAHEALKEAKKANDTLNIGNAFRVLGNICFYRENYNNVLGHYDSSLQMYSNIGDSGSMDKIINNLGLLYQQVGNFDKSIQYHLQSLSFNTRNGHNKGRVRSLINLGTLYYEMGDYGKSAQYFNEAFEYCKDGNNSGTKQAILNNLGLIAQELRSYEKSLDFFKESLEIAKQTSNIHGMADTYHNMGKSYFELGDYITALKYYNKAVEYYENLGLQSSKTLNNIGQLYIELDYYRQAIKFLKKALRIAKRDNHVTDLPEIYKNLSIAYEYLGMYKSAYTYFRKYNYYNDSLSRQYFEADLERAKRNLKVGQKESEIDKLNYENRLALEQKDNQIRIKNIIIITFAIGTIIILVFVGILLWLFFQKKKANVLLQKQNKEILRADKIIHKKNIELSESEKRLKRIIDEMPVMIDAYDKNGNIAFWNKHCEKITGYSADEIIGNKDVLRKLYPDDGYWKAVGKDPSVVDSVYTDVPTEITCKDGSIKTILWSSVSLLVPIEGWNQWAIGIDVTEKLRAQQILQKSEETLKGIFNSSPYAIVLIDLDMNIIDGNPASEEMFRIKDKSEVIGTTFSNFINPSQLKRAKQNMKEAIQVGYTKNNQYIFKRLDGTNFTAETSGSILVDPDGKPTAYVAIVNDITERIQFIEKLKHAKIDAEEADRLKTAFLANMSHEIRTPMNSIVGFSSLLTEPDNTEELKQKYLNHIINSTNSLMSLIDDIIDISKIEAGQLKITKTECHVNELLTDLYSSFSDSKTNENVELLLSFPEKGERLSFISDPLRVRQVLTNLIGNALKFTESGSIEIGYNLNKKKKETLIEFFVSDTGIGIPENKLDMIFQRFSQIEDAHTKKYGGTGLGLTISKRIVEILGGTIGVKSEIHKGSTFHFSLPFVPVTSEKKETPEVFKASKYNWKNKTILIAEDEDSNFQLLKAALDRTQIKILHAENGSEAVDIFKEAGIVDLILMDIRMPIMNGYEATRKIKAMDKNVPVISITAYAMSEDGSKSLAAGCDSYMSKPIRPGKLLAAIDKYLK